MEQKNNNITFGFHFVTYYTLGIDLIMKSFSVLKF